MVLAQGYQNFVHYDINAAEVDFIIKCNVFSSVKREPTVFL